MQEFTPEQIQEKFDQLSPEMQKAISSPDIHKKIQEVGTKYGLMINQVGELVDQVGLVMLGFARSSVFVADISSRLEIDGRKARDIATDINAQIFDSLKDILRSDDKEPEPAPTTVDSSNSSLEQAGGFEIEHDLPTNGEESYGNMKGFSAFSSGDKADMLSNIENPAPSPFRTEPISASPTDSAPRPASQKNPMIEPLVDQLLRGAAATPEEKIELKSEAKPEPRRTIPDPQPPRNLPTNDPYREPPK